MQVEPRLKALAFSACFQRLKLKFDEPLSNIGFKFSLRPYVTANAGQGRLGRGSLQPAYNCPPFAVTFPLNVVI